MALSPWPPSTAAATLTAAITQLKSAIADASAEDVRIAQLGAAAAARVQDYAPGAPQAVRDEAVIRFAGYLYQSDFGAIRREQIGPREVEYSMNHAAAFRTCGAAGLLTRWKVRRAGVLA